MAASNLNLGKASGGVLNVQPADGTTNTSLVLPASGTVVATDVAVTDNAIARYDGTTGKVQNSGVTIDDNGNVGIGTNSPSNFAGYNALTITGENTSCGGVIELNNADGSSKAHMFNNGDTFIIGTVTNHQVRIRAGATNRLTIEANGHTTVGAPLVSESTGAQLRVEAPAANDSSTASILISRYSDNYSSAMWHNYDSSYNSESFNLSVSPAEGGTSLNGIYRKYNVLGNGMHKWFGATTLSNPMTLNSNGNLLVGTTTDNGSKLQVSNGNSSLSVSPHPNGVDIVSTGNFAPHYITDFTVYKGVPGSGISKLRIAPITDNLLVGTTTDNGVDKLQVNGSINCNNKIVYQNSIIGTFTGDVWYDTGITTATLGYNMLDTFAITILEDSYLTGNSNYSMLYKFIVGSAIGRSNNASTFDIPTLSTVGHARLGGSVSLRWQLVGGHLDAKIQFKVTHTSTFDNSVGKYLSVYVTKLI